MGSEENLSELVGGEIIQEESSPFRKIEEKLGYFFKDPTLIQIALTHRSLPQRGQRDYERLEFLGDAVFDLAVAHLLIDQHPEAQEGELSKMRSALVRTSSLAELARELNLGPSIRLSRGEAANGGSDRDSILADVLEALIGAVYKEGGLTVAKECIERMLANRVSDVTPRDPKTELQEVLHFLGKEGPIYKLEFVEGPEHAPTFVSIVEIDGKIIGRGRGPTKKASQQAAAEEGLATLKPQKITDDTGTINEG